jgi:hypothetical protein
MPSVILLSVIMLSFILLGVKMLRAIMASVALNVIMPKRHYVGCHFALYQYPERHCAEDYYAEFHYA